MVELREKYGKKKELLREYRRENAVLATRNEKIEKDIVKEMDDNERLLNEFRSLRESLKEAEARLD